MEGPLLRLLISFLFINRHGHYCQFLVGWFLKIPSLKLGGTMTCYFVWKMYERFCTKCPYFMPIIQLIYGRHRQFLIMIGQKMFFKTIWPKIKLKFVRKHLWKVLYKTFLKQNDRWATQDQPMEPLGNQYYLFLFIHF